MPHASHQFLPQEAIIIPEPFRLPHDWHPDKKLQVIDMENGVLLNITQPFPETTLEQVAACLPYLGKAKTIAEMDEAIRQGAKDIAPCQVESP
ncbi:MAG: hypothetical protein WC001_01510 [Desulfurivibrionaceae bacterium]